MTPTAWQLHAPRVKRADIKAALDDVRDRTREGAEQPDADTGEPGAGLPDGTLEQIDVAIAAAHEAAQLLPAKRAHDVTIEGRGTEDGLRIVVTIARPGAGE